MFRDYNTKLQTIIWMGVGSVILTSIFSVILISLAVKTNRLINK